MSSVKAVEEIPSKVKKACITFKEEIEKGIQRARENDQKAIENEIQELKKVSKSIPNVFYQTGESRKQILSCQITECKVLSSESPEINKWKWTGFHFFFNKKGTLRHWALRFTLVD